MTLAGSYSATSSLPMHPYHTKSASHALCPNVCRSVNKSPRKHKRWTSTPYSRSPLHTMRLASHTPNQIKALKAHSAYSPNTTAPNRVSVTSSKLAYAHSSSSITSTQIAHAKHSLSITVDSKPLAMDHHPHRSTHSAYSIHTTRSNTSTIKTSSTHPHTELLKSQCTTLSSTPLLHAKKINTNGKRLNKISSSAHHNSSSSSGL